MATLPIVYNITSTYWRMVVCFKPHIEAFFARVTDRDLFSADLQIWGLPLTPKLPSKVKIIKLLTIATFFDYSVNKTCKEIKQNIDIDVHVHACVRVCGGSGDLVGEVLIVFWVVCECVCTCPCVSMCVHVSACMYVVGVVHVCVCVCVRACVRALNTLKFQNCLKIFYLNWLDQR